MTDADTVTAELGAVGRAGGIASVQRLSGGVIADVWLISYADGSRIVGKTLTGAPGYLFAVEADGLAVLRATGQLDTPVRLAPGRVPGTAAPGQHLDHQRARVLRRAPAAALPA